MLSQHTGVAREAKEIKTKSSRLDASYALRGFIG
jgi:hypothetical protein